MVDEQGGLAVAQREGVLEGRPVRPELEVGEGVSGVDDRQERGRVGAGLPIGRPWGQEQPALRVSVAIWVGSTRYRANRESAGTRTRHVSQGHPLSDASHRVPCRISSSDPGRGSRKEAGSWPEACMP